MLETWSAGSEPGHSTFLYCSLKIQVSFGENKWGEKEDSHLNVISEQNQGRGPDPGV